MVGIESTKTFTNTKEEGVAVTAIWQPALGYTCVYLNNYQPVLPVLHSAFFSKNLSKLFFYCVFLQPLVQKGLHP